MRARRRGVGRRRVHRVSLAPGTHAARIARPPRVLALTRPRARRGGATALVVGILLVGLLTLASWLTSGYFGVMAVVAVAAFAIALFAVLPVRRAGFVLGGAAAAALGASLFVAVLSVISGFGRGAGLDVLRRTSGSTVSTLSSFCSRPRETSCSEAGRRHSSTAGSTDPTRPRRATTWVS